MDQPLMLLHASDLHLDQTLYGVAALPQRAVDLFANAPLEAAERLFDVAIERKVAAVLLAGDVLNGKQAGAVEWSLLDEQFHRLADHQIQVFWSGGRAERRAGWPQGSGFPANVHCFDAGRPAAVPVERHGRPAATIVGAGWPLTDSQTETAWGLGEPELPRIALLYGKRRRRQLQAESVDYWALGGSHRRRRLLGGRFSPTACYSGPPQAFSPRFPGPHGGWLVTIDAQRAVTTEFVATDVAQWCTVPLEIAADTSPDALAQRMIAAARDLARQSGDQAFLVRWQLRTGGSLERGLRRGHTLRSLQKQLDADESAARVITCSIELPHPAIPPEQLEEDSLLGDFLRAVQRLRDDPTMPLDPTGPLAEHPDAAFLRRLIRTDRRTYREQLIDRVTQLGMDLLQPNAAERR